MHVMRLNVRAVKKTLGREGQGYICDLYDSDYKIARVEDFGDGGEPRWTWFAPKGPVGSWPSIEKRVDAEAKKLPPTVIEGMTLMPNRNTLIAKLVDEYYESKTVKRWIKAGNYVLRLSDSKPGSYTLVKNTVGRAQVMSRYPNAVVLNDDPRFR